MVEQHCSLTEWLFEPTESNGPICCTDCKYNGIRGYVCLNGGRKCSRQNEASEFRWNDTYLDPVAFRKPPWIDLRFDIVELADDCRVRGVKLCGKLVRPWNEFSIFRCDECSMFTEFQHNHQLDRLLNGILWNYCPSKANQNKSNSETNVDAVSKKTVRLLG